MKKVLLILTGLATLLFASCLRDNNTLPKNGFKLNLVVAGQESEAKTRVPVSPEAGEETVKSLYLLFFDDEPNGAGSFLNYYKVSGTLAMNHDITVDFTDGGLGTVGDQTLSNNKAYNILALANVDDNMYVDNSIADWLNSFIGLTEAQVYDNAMLKLQGISDYTDYTYRAMNSDEIPMSASLTKKEGEENVRAELTRIAVRFDVHNKANQQWDLVSASVWNAYEESNAWKVGSNDFNLERIKRLYGVKSLESDVEGDDNHKLYSDITGKLYSFENLVKSPDGRDELTTCLIVGMVQRDGSGGRIGNVTYHRVNINPAQSSQFLKRNHVYKLTINNVIGEGAPDEETAYTQNDNMLSYVINNWELDDNGMVLIDGVNTLVVPVKRIKMSPDGEVREYSIFTMGPGNLNISKIQLDNGLSATLIGNRLTVTATPMGQTEEERKGTIVLTLGSLDATIDVLQTRSEEVFLTLSRNDIVQFPAYGPGMMMIGGEIVVNASGPWTAKLYNPTSSGDNQGFSFDQTQLINPKKVITTADVYNNSIKIFTTNSNPANEPRHAFIIVELDGHPDINRSIVLVQQPATGLEVTPQQAQITFNVMGEPTSVNTFTVNPGKDITETSYNPWDVEITGTGASHFVLVKNSTINLADPQTFTITSSGMNTGVALTPTVRVFLTNSPTTETIMTIKQDKASWSVGSTHSPISDDGGTTSEIALTAPEGLTYTVSVELVDGTTKDHFAYLIDMDNPTEMYSSLKVRDVSKKFKVGFPKLIYPNIGVQPRARVTVRVVEMNEEKTFEVYQNAIHQYAVDVLNVGNSWGRLLDSQGRWDGDFNERYVEQLESPANFGTNGVVKIKNDISKANGSGESISSSVRYLHNSRPIYSQGSAQSIFNWVKSNTSDGVLFLSVDEDSRNATGSFTSNYLPGKLGLVGTSYDPDGRTYYLNSSKQDTKIIQYLIKDGPWAGGTALSGWSTLVYETAGVTSGATVSSITTAMPHAVPVLVDSNGGSVLMIDPVNNVIYAGDSEIFRNGYGSSDNGSSIKMAVLRNLLAYVINSAQYGNNFTDYFWTSPRTEAAPPAPQP